MRTILYDGDYEDDDQSSESSCSEDYVLHSSFPSLYQDGYWKSIKHPSDIINQEKCDNDNGSEGGA